MGDFSIATLESVAKALSYAAVLTAGGACAARWRLAPAIGVAEGTASSRDLVSRLAHTGTMAGIVALAAAVLRLWAHTAAAFGVADAFAWENVRIIGIESRWGAGWRVQAGTAVAVGLAFWWVRAMPLRRWGWATVASAAAIGAVPLLGHAARDPLRTVIHVGHLLGASVWVGCLAAVTLSTRGASATRAALLQRFASLALPGSALLFASGLWASWLYVGSLEQFIDSIYGRVLLLKLLLVGGVLLGGFLNWRRYRAMATRSGWDTGAAEPVPGALVVWVELAFAIMVIAVTGVLTELEHPSSS